MFDLLRSVGVPAWQIQPIFPSGRSSDEPGLHLDEDQYFAVGRFVADWSERACEAGLQLRPARQLRVLHGTGSRAGIRCLVETATGRKRHPVGRPPCTEAMSTRARGVEFCRVTRS